MTFETNATTSETQENRPNGSDLKQQPELEWWDENLRKSEIKRLREVVENQGFYSYQEIGKEFVITVGRREFRVVVNKNSYNAISFKLTLSDYTTSDTIKMIRLELHRMLNRAVESSKKEFLRYKKYILDNFYGDQEHADGNTVIFYYKLVQDESSLLNTITTKFNLERNKAVLVQRVFSCMDIDQIYKVISASESEVSSIAREYFLDGKYRALIEPTNDQVAALIWLCKNHGESDSQRFKERLD